MQYFAPRALTTYFQHLVLDPAEVHVQAEVVPSHLNFIRMLSNESQLQLAFNLLN